MGGEKGGEKGKDRGKVNQSGSERNGIEDTSVLRKGRRRNEERRQQENI